MTDDDIARQLEHLPALVNRRTALVHRGRFLRATMLVGAGSIPVYVAILDGMISEVARGPVLMRSFDFAIRAEAEAWTRFWQPMPAPGYHDLLALTRFGHATIDGDLQPLMANLRYIKDVLASPRGLLAEVAS